MASLIFFIICVICVSLKKSYRRLSTAPEEDEPKRLPRQLGKVFRHLGFLNLVFDTIMILSFSLFALEASFSFDVIWSFAAIAAALLTIFALFPAIPPSRVENKMARLVSGPLAYLLYKFEKPAAKADKLAQAAARKLHKPEPLDKKAILEFLKKHEALAAGSTKAELSLALSVLDLGSRKASGDMVRSKKAKFIETDAQVGPVLLSELHGSGRKVFPARGEGSDIVGIIRLDNLTQLKAGGRAGDVLIPQIVVIGKDDPSILVLKRFVESAAELLFVEDDKGTPIGVIYLEDVLKSFIPSDD